MDKRTAARTHRLIGTAAAAMLLAGMTAAPAPAQGAVIDRADNGFTVAHTARVAKTPTEVWDMLRAPARCWPSDHSWSGNADNFYLDAQAGGCFCEQMPVSDADKAKGLFSGSVQHAQVLFLQPGALLRLSGALGPLQGEALTGTLTVQIRAIEGGSAIRFDYVVGGYSRVLLDRLAPAVDTALGHQLRGLAEALGGALPVPDAKDADTGASDEPGKDAVDGDAGGQDDAKPEADADSR